MKERVKIAPNIFSYPDDEHDDLHMEIALGGVKNKEDIVLRMYDDSFVLKASRDDYDYVASEIFCCPVKANEAKAKFDNGMLKITVPFKERIDNPVQVKIE